MHNRPPKSEQDAATERSANSTLEMLDEALARLEQRMGIGAAGSDAGQGGEDLSAIRERQEALARQAPSAAPAGIHDELMRLREELNREMSSTIAQQFAAVREELKTLMAQGGGMAPGDLTDGFNRLTRELGLVASRVENSDASALRGEIEELGKRIGALAQEETVRDMAERWSVVEREIVSLPQSMGSREDLQTVANRVSEIQEALHTLPNAGAVDAMEGQIRTLAEAVEALASHKTALSSDHLNAIDRRLDEISHAIAGISASSASVEIDNAPFERMEARLSALASQIEQSNGALQADGVENRLAEIAERLGAMQDTLSSTPETADAVNGLARRLDDIVQRLDAEPGSGEGVPADLLDSLNGRFEEIARRLDAQHASFEETGTRLFQSIDGRMEELARRIDEMERDEAPVPTFDHMERRIEEIAQMLSSGDALSPDAHALEALESQIAALTEKLSAAPSADNSALADLAPRLVAVTDQLAGGREDMIAAARDAAEEILARFSSGISEDDRGVLVKLAGDLRGLDEMARTADDRNSRTFEAIHDTLIKVADRIAGLEESLRGSDMPAAYDQAGSPAEARQPEYAEAEAPVNHIDDAPPLDYAAGEDRAARAGETEYDRREEREPVSPAEAAALAARAAIGEEPGTDELASGMDELAGMVAARRAATSRADALAGADDDVPARENVDVPSIEPDIEESSGEIADETPAVFGKAQKNLDEPDLADEPLEPGSGGPDLAAIMKRVRAERDGTATPQPEAPAEDDDSGKSDFIAAARRAARAAAAEASVYEATGSGEDGNSKHKGRGGFLASRRRPLMLGAGAILLALLAIPLVRGYLPVGGDTPKEVSNTQEPAPAAVAETPSEDGEPVRVVDAPDRQPAGDEMAQAPIDEAEPVAPAEPQVIEAPTEEDVASAAMAGDSTAGEDMASAEMPAAERQAAETAPVDDGDTVAGVDETIRTSGYQTLSMADIPTSVGPVALRQAAVEGDPKAIFVIGDKLMGDGSDASGSDMKAAAHWYEMAAEMGFAPAQYRIGNAYEKGVGVERDLQAAMTWYRQAAEQGNVNAMHNLAVLYATEIDGERDMKEAARWFLEAAERGVKDSQVNLGILSARGEGVPQDLGEAYKWLALAAKAGDKDAASKRDEVAKFIDPKKLEMAKGAVELWKPRQPDPTANGVEMPEEWKVGKETTASVPAQTPVDMKKAIQNIQAILNNAGFDAGKPDGIMGDKTRQAISEFQKAHNMVPTGEIDRGLVDKLLEINRQS